MFIIVWSDDAFEDMSLIVAAYPIRKREFALALRQIELQLGADPLAVGESREEDMRVTFAGELTVFYRVDAKEETVEIGAVRLRRW
jgi:plasmid stabilization system protein ParE